MRSSLRVTVRERVREVEEKGEGERMTGGSGPVHVGKITREERSWARSAGRNRVGLLL